MPFDADLILVNGTVDCDAADAATHVPAITTSAVAATGAAVVDLGESGVHGVAAVLIMPTLTSSNDYLIAFIETSDTLDMTGASNDVHEVGKFDVLATTKGRILASETPCVSILRFATDKRYVRANLTPYNDGGVQGNMGAVKVYLTPFPFKVL